MTRRTELEHRGQSRFEDHFLLHTTTANRRKPGERFEEIVERGARLTLRQRDKAFADETQRRCLRVGRARNIDRADRGRIIRGGQHQQRVERDERRLRRIRKRADLGEQQASDQGE